MKRVLFLVNHDVVIYNFRRELVEELLKEGCEVIISSPYGERIDLLKDLGCKYIETKLDRHGTNPITEIKLLFYYMELIKAVKPDIILSYTIKPNLYGALAAAKCKVPILVNITGLGSAVENPGCLQKAMITAYKIAFQNVKKIFVQNEENQHFFVQHHISEDKLKLLPGSGVNLQQFHVLDYPEGENVEFVFISRIMKEKGIITYHGLIMDIRDVLQYTHCTVHPTYYPEGISNVLLESAASGRPIITTDRSGCREVVDDGVNGYMVPQKDSKALIQAVEKFLKLSNKERFKMGLAARAKVEREFDRKVVVEAYMKEVNHE